MTISEWAKLVSTLFTFLGAVGLGYDLLTGYPKRNQADIIRTQLQNLNAFKQQMEAEYRKLGQPYTAGDIQKLVDTLNQEFPTTDLENRLKTLTGRHEEVSFVLGWAGFYAIAFGFFIEFVLALVPLLKAHGLSL
jgi:hypothetical protein